MVNAHKRADLSLSRSEICLNTLHHQHICTSKQHIQLVEILCNSLLSHFTESKCVLDDFKCVFNLAAYSRFSVFNISFPIYSVIRYFRQTFGAAVYAIVNT